MYRRISTLALSALIAASVLSSPARADSFTYAYTDLTPSTGSSSAAAIHGSTVAGSFNDAGAEKGYIYDGSSYAPVAVAGAVGTYIFASNGTTVTGNYFDSSYISHGYSFNGSSYSTFGPTGSSIYSTNPVAINAGGVIGGSYQDVLSFATSGFTYDGSTFTSINDPLAANGTYVTVVANNNDALGNYTDSSYHNHGFLFDGSSYTTIDPVGSIGTFITGVNSSGLIVGYFDDSSYSRHGFTYDPTSTDFTFLNDPGALETIITGVTDSGDLIGYTTNGPSHITEGFFYDGTFHTIDDPNATKGSTVTAIDGNTLVGNYFDNSFTGHAFEVTLTPNSAPVAPLPSAAWTGLALIGLVGFRRIIPSCRSLTL